MRMTIIFTFLMDCLKLALTSKGNVMVSFMSQLDWATGCLDIGQILFWLFLWGCLWIRLTFKLIMWIENIACPNSVGLIQSLEGLIRIKRLKSSQVRDTSFSAFKWKQLLFLDLDLPVLRLEPHPWFPGSQASGFGLKLYHRFSWSLACTITLKI